MEDFIFGTLITDELKLIHQRAHKSGLQHNYATEPLRPLPEKPVTVSVLVGADLDVDHVACYYTTDGSLPQGAYGKTLNGKSIMLSPQEVNWDTLTWGYAQAWRGQIPAQPEGVFVRYLIGAWKGGDAETFADWPNPKHRQEVVTHAHFQGATTLEFPPDDPAEGRIFGYHLNRFQPPQWARQAVIYHIFVDRFYPGDGRQWNQVNDLRAMHGGTLWGVRDKLDYIQELGADVIWLSPTWPSSSYHGYDVTDYLSVHTSLGGDAAMHALVQEAHQRGMKVLLDFVCNHTSNEHEYFLDALQNPNSPYRHYFIFDESEIGYRTFFGVPTMPQVNLQYQAARNWMIENARFWLREFHIDGFRLDHANGPGPEFWSDFQRACKEVNPDSFCFGEVVEPPVDYLPYAGRLDGLLDFSLNDALRRTFGFGSFTTEQFQSFLSRHRAFFKHAGLLMPTFLDNHDLDRFLFIAANDKDKLRAAAEIQFEQPGPPIIYYGTEVGMSQETNEGRNDGLIRSRAPMVWGSAQDRHLFDFYRTLIDKRMKRRPWQK